MRNRVLQTAAFRRRLAPQHRTLLVCLLAASAGVALAWSLPARTPHERRDQQQALSKASDVTVAIRPTATRAPTAQAGRRFSVRLVSHNEFVGAGPGPFTPFNPHLTGVDSQGPREPCREPQWEDKGPVNWQSVFAQGEYIGPPRVEHVPVYRLRVDDLLVFAFRITRNETAEYKLNVGDEIRIESETDTTLDRLLTIQPDGMVTLRLLGQVRAAGRTVTEMKDGLNRDFKKYLREPAITVTPTRTNTKLDDLRAVVDARAGFGGQNLQETVSPDGTVVLPAINRVPAQGLTLDELRHEINERYLDVVEGIEVTPSLRTRAPTNIYVLGEVNTPGRYALTGPTSAMHSIALAGGWRIGGNLRQIVIFRRTANWRLVATKLDLKGALRGHRPAPADEIWLRDSDIVLVPKAPIQVSDDFINLFFTQGIYGVFPNQGFSFTSLL